MAKRKSPLGSVLRLNCGATRKKDDAVNPATIMIPIRDAIHAAIRESVKQIDALTKDNDFTPAMLEESAATLAHLSSAYSAGCRGTFLTLNYQTRSDRALAACPRPGA